MNKQNWLAGAATAALGWSVPAAAQQADETRQGSDAQDAGNTQEEVRTAANRISDDGILVRAERQGSGLTLEDFTGSATIITPDQIEQRQTRNLEDVLRDVPGLAVSTIAGQTQIRLRGTEANHVLVLIDGIEVSDPSSGEFDIGALQAEIGSRVEVIRGPQSALYGNDAIGGVVAYESGAFDGFGGYVEGGTNDTINGAARWGITQGGIDAALAATIVSTNAATNSIQPMS